MLIAFGCDHTALTLKKELLNYVHKMGYEVIDCGCTSDERVDYPVYGEKVAKLVSQKKCDRGVVLCGTGIGISIVANKIKGIRAVACSEPYSARLSRLHNNTNILAMGARVVGNELAKMIVEIWLSTEYEGGRHQKRLDMISNIENKNKI